MAKNPGDIVWSGTYAELLIFHDKIIGRDRLRCRPDRTQR